MLNGIQELIVKFLATRITIGINGWQLLKIGLRMQQGIAHLLVETEIIGQCRSQLVGKTMATGTARQIGWRQNHGTQRYEQALDGLVNTGQNQLFALGRCEHGGIDNVLGLIALEHIGQHLDHIDTAHQTNLDDLRLEVVDDSLDLLTNH